MARQHPLKGERGRGSRGAVLIEAAFIFPILFMLVFAMVTYGNALGQKNAVENAAREASRYAARYPVESTTKQWLIDVTAVAVSASTGEMDPGTADRYICVALNNSSGQNFSSEITGNGAPVYTADANCPGVSCPGTAACTQVVLERTAEVEGVLFTQTIDIGASSVSHFERGG